MSDDGARPPSQHRQGLCTTCRHNNACALTLSSAPVWSCAEFDDGSSVRQGVVAAAPVEQPPQASSQRALPRGLCANCANLSTCLLPKADGGVWHCEEYQ